MRLLPVEEAPGRLGVDLRRSARCRRPRRTRRPGGRSTCRPGRRRPSARPASRVRIVPSVAPGTPPRRAGWPVTCSCAAASAAHHRVVLGRVHGRPVVDHGRRRRATPLRSAASAATPVTALDHRRRGRRRGWCARRPRPRRGPGSRSSASASPARSTVGVRYTSSRGAGARRARPAAAARSSLAAPVMTRADAPASGCGRAGGMAPWAILPVKLDAAAAARPWRPADLAAPPARSR